MGKRKNFFISNEEVEVSESLRTIRTNLGFLNEKDMGRKIVFTSVVPNEGKSFIASNYAASVATAGKKTLLIDCDIRRPRAHESFGIKFEKGLESILLDNASAESVIIKEILPNLDILPSRHVANGVTELFLGERVEELLDSLSPHYNTIVLDNPPIAVASDPVILSKFVDGVVLVVGYDQISKKELEFATDMLTNAHANVYGFVVNKVDRSGLSYGNYGYYNNYHHYYNEYYGDSKEKSKKKRSHKSSHKKMGKIEKFLHRFSEEYKKQISGDLKGRRK